MDPVTTFEKVTPILAQGWLAMNTHNRPLRTKHIDFLANEISNGSWRITHQGIAFSGAGNLLDGQHRLHAIVVAKKAVTMAVTRGLAEESFNAIDLNGATRTAGDVFVLRGDTRGHRRAQICNTIRRIFGDGNKKCGSDEMWAIARKFEEGIDMVMSLPSHRFFGVTVSSALAIAFKTDPLRISEFAEQVWRGANLAEGDPAFMLRAFLLGERSYSSSVDRRNASLKTLRAAVGYLQGEKMTRLSASKEAIDYFGKAHGIEAKQPNRNLLKFVRHKAAVSKQAT